MRRFGRLGIAGVVLGAIIAATFGAAAGLLAVRWASPASATESHAFGTADGSRGRSAPAEVVAPRPARAASRARAPRLERTCGSGGRLVRYRVAVGRGVPVTKTSFARGVSGILCDRRSWIGGGVRFRYDPDGPVVIRLLEPEATEERCLALIGLSVREKYSCAARARGEVVLNAARWLGGSPTWPGSVRRYRALMVNHEVGHVLGFGHRGCSGRDDRAPVMMQQSKGLGGCRANEWPVRSELRALR